MAHPRHPRAHTQAEEPRCVQTPASPPVRAGALPFIQEAFLQHPGPARGSAPRGCPSRKRDQPRPPSGLGGHTHYAASQRTICLESASRPMCSISWTEHTCPASTVPRSLHRPASSQTYPTHQAQIHQAHPALLLPFTGPLWLSAVSAPSPSLPPSRPALCHPSWPRCWWGGSSKHRLVAFLSWHSGNESD